MLALPVDRSMVSETETSVIRKCPFYDGPIEDGLGRDINFLVHLGSPTPKHQLRRLGLTTSPSIASEIIL
jgi:hypothetical protein